MRMVAVSMVLSGEREKPPEISSEIIADLCWAAAVPEDGLEHLRAWAGHGRIDLVLYVQAPDDRGALQAALTLCERVVRQCGDMNGWQTVHSALIPAESFYSRLA
jgi:hypothetical protein